MCVIRMIHPHSLYKRISPQVTGHLYEKDIEHRDQMVCSGSVTTHYQCVKGGLADQACTVCGVDSPDWGAVLHISPFFYFLSSLYCL